MVRQLLATGRNYLLNAAGKPLGKKVVVFESDDWGSIRMPSLEIYRDLVSKGISLDKNPYNRFDSLESADDLEALFSVLKKFSDHKGNHPMITANFIMANPDFEKISASAFETYHYESFRDTYKRTKATENSFDLVAQGQSENLLRPQFHGREHLNVQRWLRLLRQNNQQLRQAFDRGVFCLDLKCDDMVRDNLMASFDYETQSDKLFIEESIIVGLKMFEQHFGFKSESIIAPCNVWGDHIEDIAAAQGVKYIQSLRGRCIPQPGRSYKKDFPVMGGQNANGQYYLVRNVYFEPATTSKYDWITNAIAKIEAAFFWKKPAVISTHRLNFAGTIDEGNRTQNLSLLFELLTQITKKWPDVEFMSSDALGKEYQFLYTKVKQ